MSIAVPSARPMSSDALLDWMSQTGFEFTLYEHEPLHSVSEAKTAQDQMDPKGQGVHIKNLFLRSAKKAQFLVSLEQDTKIDLKALGQSFGKGKLSFGSPERLMTALGVKPGAVTPLSMVQGREQGVMFYTEHAVWNAPLIFMHPLINTRTIAISQTVFREMMSKLQIKVEFLDISVKNFGQ